VKEILQHYKSQPGKTPSLPTIRKYYNMDSIPAQPGKKLEKEKAFDHEPYRSAIIEIVNNCRDDCYYSSVYDVLTERFVESGEKEALPGNGQTLRNYIHYLKESGAIEEFAAKGRTYDYVPTQPPGQQMLMDFGEEKLGNGRGTIHFLCLLLRYSRVLCVLAQDHKYNSEEACRAIYRGFAKLGGRPHQLVIDQDSVFVASEEYGEVIETEKFRNFLLEQQLTLWVCNKADPESKGPIENVVGFVKKNFFSARKCTMQGIEDVLRSLPGWMERQNKRVHKATFWIPQTVFDETEKEALRPLLPSVYESAALGLISTNVSSMPYIQYKSSKYSVPVEYCFSTVFYKATGSILNIYDKDRRHICRHTISECRGSINQLEEHKNQPSEGYQVVVGRLRDKWNCHDFQHFINGFKKENPRHISAQLIAVEKFLNAENPSKSLVARVMDTCCQHYRYRFSQFKDIYEKAKIEEEAKSAPPKEETPTVRPQCPPVQTRDLSYYQEAFEERGGKL